MTAYAECPQIDSLFDMVRGRRGVDVDWVKFQVYGAQTVPETFPTDVPSLESIIDRLSPAEEGEIVCRVARLRDG